MSVYWSEVTSLELYNGLRAAFTSPCISVLVLRSSVGATIVGEDTVGAATIGEAAGAVDVTGLGDEGSGRVDVDVGKGGTVSLTGLDPGDWCAT